MEETKKTKKLWGDLERSILSGKGIDIGCGSAPVSPDARRFDVEDGDANYITKYVQEQFDYVYASHCLEHMHKPREAILEWWKLVRVGGYIFFIVPDEDLYEQGVFPPRFNTDHKATFTLSKQKSWSPASINVLELASSLPNGKLISLYLQDQGYDRRLMKHGPVACGPAMHFTFRAYRALKRRTQIAIPFLERLRDAKTTYDQTLGPEAVAQIQCIVQKTA
ncbi:MAG: methyltransferase domain-containing protein [Verrucomicrobiae bacterium]|nr:methyltransferase domain-containing protein [Verrucomicrobiae bacterium]